MQSDKQLHGTHMSDDVNVNIVFSHAMNPNLFIIYHFMLNTGELGPRSVTEGKMNSSNMIASLAQP